MNKSAAVQSGGAPGLTAESFLPLSTTGHVKELYYPTLLRPVENLVAILFGGALVVAGVYMWSEGASEGLQLYIMSVISFLAGCWVTLYGTYSALHKQHIRFDGQSLTSISTVLGVTVSSHILSYDDISSVKSKLVSSSNTGKKHTVEYNVIARFYGDEITLAKNLDSASKAEIVVEYFKLEFGLMDS